MNTLLFGTGIFSLCCICQIATLDFCSTLSGQSMFPFFFNTRFFFLFDPIAVGTCNWSDKAGSKSDLKRQWYRHVSELFIYHYSYILCMYTCTCKSNISFLAFYSSIYIVFSEYWRLWYTHLHIAAVRSLA